LQVVANKWLNETRGFSGTLNVIIKQEYSSTHQSTFIVVLCLYSLSCKLF